MPPTFQPSSYIGMSGSGYVVGIAIAIASYELMAVATLLIIAKYFLSIFISKGIYTRPQFLEQRFDTLVNLAATAAISGQIKSLGELLFQSPQGLQYEYEVSCAELDILVDQAAKLKGVAGSRMMGGGFGGCTINLIRKDLLDEFKESILKAYQHKFNINLEIYQPQLTNGTSLI